MKTPSRIYLRHPTLTDQRAFLAAVQASRSLHRPWVKPPSTPLQFRSFVAQATELAHCGLLVCRRDDDALAGVINISNMVRGIFRSGYLGYYAFAGAAGQGLLGEGLQAAVRHAFRSLKLHRLEANIQPGNVRSLALVQARGFSREGYSPCYLKIGGRWRDHERWAIVAS